MSRRRQLAAALVAALALGTAGARAAKIDLGSIGDAVKIMGIGFAVKTFGGQINQAINTVLMQNNIERHGATKVVPILSVGQGAYIGAAQVTGPENEVAQVQAVVQGEVTASGGQVRFNALVPVDSINPFQSLPKPKFKGVGITAIIDFNV
ncbi:MAG TPA: hypothetical protein PLU39_09870 [Armatimonadota bacterium]|jgi:hypothetical protein|nr:hypothetical protein [Armatimonadota bacterium]HOJ21348.1 hypothetical protein [Armatimonadota bacterium]HOM80915.1 hypothetical protein [Armatimonadota bacterium]HPT98165.1 hypothetical protein [Armatimonadota bacterium]